jgi:hypothetical protein
MPMLLMVKPRHRLLDRGSSISFADQADYPVLPMPDGAFPMAQRVLKEINLWACPERNQRLRRAKWFGQVPVEELMIVFDNPLRQAAGLSEGWLPLPIPLPLVVGEELVLKREFATSPHLQTLMSSLCSRARQLAEMVENAEGWVLGSAKVGIGLNPA